MHLYKFESFPLATLQSWRYRYTGHIVDMLHCASSSHFEMYTILLAEWTEQRYMFFIYFILLYDKWTFIKKILPKEVNASVQMWKFLFGNTNESKKAYRSSTMEKSQM